MCDIFISAVTHNLPAGAAGPRTHISQSGHGHHHHHCLGSKTMQLDWKLEWAGLFLCPFVWIWSQVFGSDWILCRFDIGTGPPPASTSSSTPSAESLIRGFCLEWGNHINFTISFSWQVRAYHHNNIKLHITWLSNYCQKGNTLTLICDKGQVLLPSGSFTVQIFLRDILCSWWEETKHFLG